MKAAQLKSYGDKGSLVVNSEATKPKAEAGQVLVEVYAAATNPFDFKVREGLLKQYIPITFPAVLGGDVSGLVTELGEGVSDFKIGQPVFGQANAVGGNGSFAEFTPVSVKQLAVKPDSIDFKTAAALPLVASSAYQALFEHIGLQTSQKILIHGGAGGIGSIAVQLAKDSGAFVAATASSEDIDYVKQLGADQVIDYTKEDFSQIIKDYDAVFDTVGGETTEKSYQVLKSGGALVSMSSQANEELVNKFSIHFTSQQSKVTTEKLNKIAELVKSGKLKVNVDKTFTLDEASEALEYLKSSHPRGKVVIEVKS